MYWHGKCVVKSCNIPGSKMFKLNYSYLEVGMIRKAKDLLAIVFATILSYALLQLFITTYVLVLSCSLLSGWRLLISHYRVHLVIVIITDCY